MGPLADGQTQALALAIPRLIDTELGLLCDAQQQPLPALPRLLQDCRDAARATSDSLNTLFFAHSGESSQSVGA
jgi:hypothetical protein